MKIQILIKGASSDGSLGSVELIFLFIIIAILLGIFFKFFQKYAHYEYTPILLIIGIILGAAFKNVGHLGSTFEYISGIDGHALLLIFIPPLLFESAFNADSYIFRKSIFQIVFLAFPAVAVSVLLITVSLLFIFRYKGPDMNWGGALSLGSILAATDPVAVVAILKSTGAKIKLNMLIEGESLLNDGSAAIFFFVFKDMINTPGFSFVTFLQKFARLTLGGVALGFASGIVFYFILMCLHNDILVTVFSFIAAYITFFLAESTATGFHVSGILAVVVLGLYLGATLKPRLNPHYAHTLHAVWHFGQFIMETMLFLLTGTYIGVSISELQQHITAVDIGKVIGFNFVLLFIRFFVLAISWPFLNCMGYKVTWKEYLIMGWSGLRGAIGLAIGLIVALDHDLGTVTYRNLVIFYIACVILFTVLFQGMTMKCFMKLVRYNRLNTTKKRLWKDLRRRLFLSLLEKSENLRSNKLITYQVSWAAIYRVFGFSKYIMDLDNMDSFGKPLVLDYDYTHDTDALVEKHVDKLDHLISDDEIETYIEGEKKRREQNEGVYHQDTQHLEFGNDHDNSKLDDNIDMDHKDRTDITQANSSVVFKGDTLPV